MFSLFLRPISPRDVQLYALRDEIEHSKRFYLSPSPVSSKQHKPIVIEFSETRKSENKLRLSGFSVFAMTEKRDEIEHSKRFYLSPSPVSSKQHKPIVIRFYGLRKNTEKKNDCT